MEPVAFHQEDAGRVLVEVHQVVRDLVGTVLADEHVGHRFTFERGLIRRMEVSRFLRRLVNPSGYADVDWSSPLSRLWRFFALWADGLLPA